jgi:FSR family fosmidomycin resistance protein-like MFS transporter
MGMAFRLGRLRLWFIGSSGDWIVWNQQKAGVLSLFGKEGQYYDKRMSTSSNPAVPVNAVPLREDVRMIGLVGLGHMVSHFSQLLLPPLFPWLKDEFGVGYAELGLLLSIFFVVSCAMQALSGFAVDRFGPRRILFLGLGLLGVAALGYSISTSYAMLAGCAVIAGLGNGVFHPVDFTLLNRKVSVSRLGHAYSAHGITGSLGWALAPALVVPLTLAYSWRVALATAGVLIFIVLLVLIVQRDRLALQVLPAAKQSTAADDSFGFLKIPAVWMCFAFFFFNALVVGIVKDFAPEAARHLHAVPLSLAAVCVTVYMLGSAGGMVLGGFLASNPLGSERIVGIGFGLGVCFALLLALGKLSPPLVPVVFGLMGFVTGIAGPSRDLLVKRSTPDNSTGRVYGVVYSGLDTGHAIAPLFIGVMMDRGFFSGVLLCLAFFQGVLIISAFNVRSVRRTPLAAV